MQDRLTPQADRLVFASAYRAECHVAAGRFFGNVHIGLGAVAAGLAVAAGGTAFAFNNDLLTGSIAILAAIVTGLLTTLRPDERSQGHWNAANGFADLANRTYMVLLNGGFRAEAESRHDGADTGPDRGTRRDPLAEIEAFQREFRRLDAAAPPLPGRLTKKGRQAMARHRTWHPPQYDEFDSWRTEVLSPRRRWRAAPVIDQVLPEQVQPGQTVEVWGRFLLPPSPSTPKSDSGEPKPYVTIGGLACEVEIVEDGQAGVDRLRVIVPVQFAAPDSPEQEENVTLEVYTALGERAAGSRKLRLIRSAR